MKKLLVIALSILLTTSLFAQKKLPNTEVKDETGTELSIRTVLEADKPTIMVFWSTTCKNCIIELNALNDVYEEWLEEIDFQVVAVSIDDARSTSKAVPFAKGNNWPFTIMLDANSDLKRTMNVQVEPTTFILDAKGKVLKTFTGYTTLSENAFLDVLLETK